MTAENRSRGGVYPPYSCLISVYYKEDAAFLRNCLDCILAQTVKPDEILVVKDGPLTEELDGVLSEYDNDYSGLFTFFCNPENKGLWYALSVGIPACRNEFIMRMDVDDWSIPDRAEKQLALFECCPELGCVGSTVLEFEDNIGNIVSLVDLPEANEEIVQFGQKRCPFRHPSLMYRTSTLEKAGGDQRMPYFEDYDLYMRLKNTGCVFRNIQEPLVYVRVSRDFYARRGGLSYMRDMLRFKTACLKRRDYGLFEFLACTTPHILVCLMPNILRTWVYKRFLRASAPADLRVVE